MVETIITVVVAAYIAYATYRIYRLNALINEVKATNGEFGQEFRNIIALAQARAGKDVIFMGKPITFHEYETLFYADTTANAAAWLITERHAAPHRERNAFLRAEAANDQEQAAKNKRVLDRMRKHSRRAEQAVETTVQPHDRAKRILQKMRDCNEDRETR